MHIAQTTRNCYLECCSAKFDTPQNLCPPSNQLSASDIKSLWIIISNVISNVCPSDNMFWAKKSYLVANERALILEMAIYRKAARD